MQRDEMDPNDKRMTHLVKVAVMGDCAVGKTSLLTRLCSDSFSRSQNATMGVDFATKTFQSSDSQRHFKLQFWDISGAPRFASSRELHVTGALVFIVAFDINNRESFEHVVYWLNVMKWTESVPFSTPYNEHALVYLVGTKYDLDHMRTVTREEALAFADEHGLSYFEVSAKTGACVQDEFNRIVRDIDKQDNDNRGGTTRVLDFESGKEFMNVEDDDSIIFYDYTNFMSRSRWRNKCKCCFF